MIFLIVPMINVDGVIAGNYRTSMAGNDLNRRYIEPDQRVHPEVCLIKTLVQELITGRKKDKKGHLYRPSRSRQLDRLGVDFTNSGNQ